MEMARKALVAAFSIGFLLLVSAPSMANFYGPGFGLNGLFSGWGVPSSCLAAPCGGIGTGPLCGSGVLSTSVAPFGCGTIPSCAIAGSSYAGSPGVFCSGFGGVPVPVPVPAAVPMPAPVPACVGAPVCAPAAAPVGCGLAK